VEQVGGKEKKKVKQSGGGLFLGDGLRGAKIENQTKEMRAHYFWAKWVRGGSKRGIRKRKKGAGSQLLTSSRSQGAHRGGLGAEERMGGYGSPTSLWESLNEGSHDRPQRGREKTNLKRANH